MTISARLSAALLVPLAAIGCLLPACSGDSSQVATNGIPRVERQATKPTVRPATTPTTTRPTTTRVGVTVPTSGIVIQNFQYLDMVAKAHAVNKVVNKDSAPHTLTADDLSFDTKTIDGNATGEFTAPGPGAYKIHCVLHPFMTATLTVIS
jgi:hypothetical protein